MKFHRKTRMTYWSHSKLFSWMMPEETKQAFTFEMLKEQIATGVDKTPKIERVVDFIQNTVMFPSDLIYSVRTHFKNVKGNTHVLDGGLNKGQWYDLTYRIPQCLFYELEKFIEKEKGLETHEWEKTIVYNEDYGLTPEDEDYGVLTPQALAAIEQDEIYKWWKENKDKTDRFDGGKYKEEETEMLIRLIKIRDSLWT